MVNLVQLNGSNPLRHPLVMQLFSRGNLYIGKDEESFTLIQIHLGRFRLEWERKPKPHGSRPTTKKSN